MNNTDTYLNYRNWVSNLPFDRQNNLLNWLKKFGDSSEVFRHLYNMQPCYATKEISVYADKRFVMWGTKKTLFNEEKWYIILTNEIDDIYYNSNERCPVGIVMKDGLVHNYLKHYDGTEVRRLYYYLQDLVANFKNIPLNNQVREFVKPGNLKITVNSQGLYEEVRAGLNGTKKRVLALENLAENIIWCEQTESAEDNGPILKLYMMNKLIFYLFDLESHKQALEIAKALKEKVPHLIYGPDMGYYKILKKNPAALMEIAKSQMNNMHCGI